MITGRRLGPADAGEYLTVQRAAYVTEAQVHDNLLLPPLTETLEEMRAVLAGPSTRAWGVRENGRLVAAVRVVLDGDVGRVGRLAVVPDRQGEGLGTALMRRVEHELAGSVRAVELFTGELSAGPLRLYRGLGYREVARTPEADYDLIHLRRDLDGGDDAPEPVVRRARPDDGGAVVALLDERVRWLHERGVTGQWDGPFDPAWLRGDLDAGWTWLVEQDGVPVATFVLAPGAPEDDPWWADVDDPAATAVVTLRRLAVRPGHAGLGARLLDWVERYAATHGADRLRLTCVAGNAALCRYYAAAGFDDRGTIEVAGTRGEGRTFLMRRFEKRT